MEGKIEQSRRYFPRVKMRAHATLVDNRGERWPIHMLDLSFNGALVALIRRHDLAVGEGVELLIDSVEGSGVPVAVRMQGQLRHVKAHYLGVECRATGIDNQTQLRELLKRSQRRQHNFAERSYAREGGIKALPALR